MKPLQELPPGFRWSFSARENLLTLELHKRWLFFWTMQDYEPVSMVMVRAYGLDVAQRIAASRMLERNPLLVRR